MDLKENKRSITLGVFAGIYGVATAVKLMCGDYMTAGATAVLSGVCIYSAKIVADLEANCMLGDGKDDF